MFFVNFPLLNNTASDLSWIELYVYNVLIYHVDCGWRVSSKKRNIIVDIFLQISDIKFIILFPSTMKNELLKKSVIFRSSVL